MSKVMSAILRAGEIIAGGVRWQGFYRASLLMTLGVLVFMALSMHAQRTKTIEDVSAKYFYTLALSAFSVVIASMLLFPYDMTFRHYPLDFSLCVAWFVSFAFLLIEFTGTEVQSESEGWSC